MNNINDKGRFTCIGCGACTQTCGRDFVIYKENSEGFYEARSDESKCVSCGNCKKVCYKYFDDVEEGFNIEDAKVYKVKSKDKNILENTSSGGVAFELYKEFLKRGYIVSGAAYDYEKHKVKHILIENEEDINTISTSKYIPSYTEAMLNSLDYRNKKYLIIGTPCQIHGFRKVIKHYRREDNFVLVDFFCHGTPSIFLWRKYLDHVRKKEDLKDIKKVNFRDKKTGWHTYSIMIQDERKTYRKMHLKDKFFKFFLREKCLMESCYDCQLRFNKLYSDIRLGDYWGKEAKDDKEGVSIVLINSEKGAEAFNSIKDKFEVEEKNFESLKESQGRVIEYLIPKDRGDILKALNSEKNLQQIYNKYMLPEDIKRGIKRRIKNLIFKELFHVYIN